MLAALDAFSSILPDLAWLFTQSLGFCGVLLILYSVLAEYTTPWPPIEKAATFISSLLTILGTVVTALSIYVPSSSIHVPWPHSRYIVAPAVITAGVIATVFLVRRKTLPPMLINGFALLAMSGGLKRLLPNPHLPS